MSRARPRTRQELYDRIRESSRDEVILEDMIRLGFWPERGQIPADPADEIRRKGELERQIAALRSEQARLHDVEAMRRALRKQRLEAARQKRRETRERRERERLARAAAWRERKRQRIVYLGAGVSGGLSGGAPMQPERLALYDLPELASAEQVAQAMGIPVGELRFLAFARRTAQRSHYVRFRVPKKSGGVRLIAAPMPRLKRAQRWLLERVLGKVALRDEAHGFVPARSIVSNARPHVGAAVVVNVDLQDFFPTFTFRRIKGLFEGLGYGEEVATLFALLASEPEVDEAELDGRRYFVARGARRLPQGSPASPALTNIVCRRLDARLSGLSRRLGFVYTRYADDLTFSSHDPHADCGTLLRRVRYVVTAEGLTVHPQKTRILRRGRKQEVTGVGVTDRPSVDRSTLRRFRALLFQLEKDGPEGKRWGERQGVAVLASAVGFASYVTMIDPERGRPLLERARALQRRHGGIPLPRPRPPVDAAAADATPRLPMQAAPAEEQAGPDPPADFVPPATGTFPTQEPPKKRWRLF